MKRKDVKYPQQYAGTSPTVQFGTQRSYLRAMRRRGIATARQQRVNRSKFLADFTGAA